MAQSNYYDILGISKNATPEDIKAAYKRLAKEHHPDVAKDKTAAEAKFKEINEAYQVLSDPQKKKMYDTYGTAQPGFGGGQGPFGGAGQKSGQWGPFTYTYTSGGGQGFEGFGNFDPFDIFEEVFGFRNYAGRRPRRGRNIDYEMAISFADSVKGREEEISLGGKKLKIKIPQGIRDGNELRFEGQGEPAPEAGLPAGDLHITIRIYPHKVFQRHGDDIYIAKEISFIDAALGAEVEIPIVDPNSQSAESKTKLKIPAGTQPDTEFRIKGKGMPKLRAFGRGDMFVRILVRIPDKLSKDQKRILEDFKKAS